MNKFNPLPATQIRVDRSAATIAAEIERGDLLE